MQRTNTITYGSWERTARTCIGSSPTHGSPIESPSFAPDGTKVVFSRCQNDPGLDQGRCADRDGRPGYQGNHAPHHAPAEELAFWPKYSADGTQIAFTVFDGRGVRAGIFVMDADGSDVDLVTPPKLRAGMPDWAPDGSRLIFASPFFTPRAPAISAVNPDGTGLTRLTERGDHHDYWPVFSPDGAQIVFERDSADYSRFRAVHDERGRNRRGADHQQG